MSTHRILFFFHCGSNTGYAISPLEKVFYQVGRNITGSDNNIHFAYPDLGGGMPTTLPDGFGNVIRFDPKDAGEANKDAVAKYVRQNGIDIGFGFDQPVKQPTYRALRAAGINKIISYWGAPMSSLNSGIKLLIKRLDVMLHFNRPDHFIFESRAMAETAIKGRAICQRDVSIVYLGADTNRFQPCDTPSYYAHDQFNIPRERKIVFYSGHMEARKGVAVLIHAAVELARRRSDVHFLLLGNRSGEEMRFASIYHGERAERHITFGGYRSDIPDIHRSCYAGVIASIGWDSLTMSAVEMAASGVPMVVSALQGLKETVEPGKTGYLFAPGNHIELANRLDELLSDSARRDELSKASRVMAIERFTVERQVAGITEVVKRVIDSPARWSR